MKNVNYLMNEICGIKIYNTLAKNATELELCGSVYFTEGLEAYNYPELMLFDKKQMEYTAERNIEKLIELIADGEIIQEGVFDKFDSMPMLVQKECILDKEYLVFLPSFHKVPRKQEDYEEKRISLMESLGFSKKELHEMFKTFHEETVDPIQEMTKATMFLDFTKRRLNGEDLSSYLQPLQKEGYDIIKYQYYMEKYATEYKEETCKAHQIAGAIDRLYYQWHQNGSVFDDSIPFGTDCTDVSSYANWLDKYTDEAGEILSTFTQCETYRDYDELLLKLCEVFLNEEYLSQYVNKRKVGNIYKCRGRFKYSQ